MSDQSNLPAVRQSAQVVRAQEWMNDQTQLSVVRRDLAPGLDDAEFSVFCGVCSSTGLNPIMRQIHAIKRNDKNSPTGKRVTYQIGIDGFRLIAERTGCYAGSDEADFEERPGNPYPVSARVTVWKIVKGIRAGFSATARWREYYPGEGADGFMWRIKPFLMLAKCAEALALRKAFPAETSGLYAHEEMMQADAIAGGEIIDVPPAASSMMPRRASEAAVVVETEAKEDPEAARRAECERMDREELAAQERERAAALGEGKPQPDWSQPGWRQVRIAKYSSKSGQGKRGPWTRHAVMFSTEKAAEVWASTFSETVGGEMKHAHETQAPAVWLRLQKGKDANFDVQEVFVP